jgi:hypothetical protein
MEYKYSIATAPVGLSIGDELKGEDVDCGTTGVVFSIGDEWC